MRLGRSRALHLNQHVRAPVLHRLETTDRPTELNSILGVVDGHIEAPLRRADLFGRQRDEREVRCAGKEVRGTTVCSDQLRRCAVELHPRHLAGAVESGQRRATKPSGPARTANNDTPASVMAGAKTTSAV